MAVLSIREQARREVYAEAIELFPFVADANTLEAGVGILSVAENERMSEDFIPHTVAIPSLEAEPFAKKQVLQGLEAAILDATARRQSLATQPPLCPKKWAGSINKYKQSINSLIGWLQGTESPVIATVEGGDKGWYATPETLKGTGSEVYALNTARHCEHFPGSEEGRPFSDVDSTLICCRLWQGQEQIGWPAERTIAHKIYDWLGHSMNRIARHELKPKKRSDVPGSRWVRGSVARMASCDGLQLNTCC